MPRFFSFPFLPSSASSPFLSLSLLTASPVADFGAQSLIIGAVRHVFPNDGIVGEEDSGLLREQASTRELVWQLVRDTVEESQELSDEIGAVKDETEMMDLIDRGSHAGGASGRPSTPPDLRLCCGAWGC